MSCRAVAVFHPTNCHRRFAPALLAWTARHQLPPLLRTSAVIVDYVMQRTATRMDLNVSKLNSLSIEPNTAHSSGGLFYPKRGSPILKHYSHFGDV
jgi:hypothetical protein